MGIVLTEAVIPKAFVQQRQVKPMTSARHKQASVRPATAGAQHGGKIRQEKASFFFFFFFYLSTLSLSHTHTHTHIHDDGTHTQRSTHMGAFLKSHLK